MISRKTVLGDIISSNPEIIPLLAQAGLHCIGCHVSAYESIEDGCKTHGMTDKQIDDLIVEANKRAKEYDGMPKIALTKSAVLELKKRVTSSKAKYAKIFQVYGGDFDFDAVNEKEPTDVEIDAGVKLLLEKRIERILRGIEIDFNSKLKDFTAKKVGVKKENKAKKKASKK